MKRVDADKSESDHAYFFSLLLAGEALFKTITLGLIAALEDDRNRNRYRLEHSLVRADGLGEWGRALEDALSGPASQFLVTNAYPDQKEFTLSCGGGTWQFDAVSKLKSALEILGIESEALSIKTDLKRWFRLFVVLRNKTRAHGATPISQAALAAADVESSIRLIYENLSLFRRSWGDLHRNYSGKYRVLPVCGDTKPFDELRKESNHSYSNGVHIYFGSCRRVPLLSAAAELRDFYFANGAANGKKFEMLSYYTGDRTEGDISEYLTPPGSLPASETEGNGELLPRGKCLSNAPDLLEDYVSRSALEKELHRLLVDDRHLIITLLGRGGIGKTSLSLKVIHELFDLERYSVIVWLSARDVDLQLSGPKPVKPLVLTPDEMGKLYASLVLSEKQLREKGFNARVYFETQLAMNDAGPCLYVFDNFETTQNPVDAFNWIETFIRTPNKALITTRLRDFKGDYWVEVGGMREDEARLLIDRIAAGLGVTDKLTASVIEDILSASEGHPYIIRILLGDIAQKGSLSNASKVLSSNEEILTALFERTYASLSPCAQRALLTLAAWNSSVPRIALEAVLMRSTAERQEVESGIESLLNYSMAEIHVAASDNQIFIRLPLIATAFGKKKLNISPLKASIQRDAEILQMLGPSRRDDVHLGLAHKLNKLIENIARRVDTGQQYSDYSPIVEMICHSYPAGWVSLARWHLESESQENLELARTELQRYLEEQPNGAEVRDVWKMLGIACHRLGDSVGEIHAFIERSQLAEIPFHEVSNTANRLNALLREQDFDVEKDEKQHLANRLLLVMEARRDEATGTDFSRMAWLAMHTDQQAKALEFTQAGLHLSPNNTYCISLSDKLNGGAR